MGQRFRFEPVTDVVATAVFADYEGIPPGGAASDIDGVRRRSAVVFVVNLRHH